GAHLQSDGDEFDAADGARSVCDVRDSRDSLRELRAPADCAFNVANSARRWFVDADPLRAGSIALRVRRYVHVDGYREEERHHDRRLRAPSSRGGRAGGQGDSRCEHGSFPADSDDDAGGGVWRHSDRARLWSGWLFAAAVGPRGGWWIGGVAVHHAVHHPRDLSVP